MGSSCFWFVLNTKNCIFIVSLHSKNPALKIARKSPSHLIDAKFFHRSYMQIVSSFFLETRIVQMFNVRETNLKNEFYSNHDHEL
jgi:hypothetical protein